MVYIVSSMKNRNLVYPLIFIAVAMIVASVLSNRQAKPEPPDSQTVSEVQDVTPKAFVGGVGSLQRRQTGLFFRISSSQPQANTV